MVTNDDWLVEQLPRAMDEDRFLRQFVLLVQEMATGIRRQVEDIPAFVDVHTAPEAFVRWMGQWLGLTVEPTIVDDEERERRLRRLVEEVGTLFVRRGTRAGLEGLLTAITGEAAHVADTGGVFRSGQAEPNAKHAVVYLNGTGGIDEQALLGLVSAEIPVDVSFEFRIGEHEVVREESEEIGLSALSAAVTAEPEDDLLDGEAMPEWATDGSADVTEAAAGASSVSVAERPVEVAPGARPDGGAIEEGNT